MKQIQGGVTAAKGFEAAGVEAAIKYQNRKDMALRGWTAVRQKQNVPENC